MGFQTKSMSFPLGINCSSQSKQLTSFPAFLWWKEVSQKKRTKNDKGSPWPFPITFQKVPLISRYDHNKYGFRKWLKMADLTQARALVIIVRTEDGDSCV